ncbi:MAG TPA: carbohydrate ABC transporter permease [Trebonia sp.]|nr:carbohydrate ABC transporter permease [Trebonia sp.]
MTARLPRLARHAVLVVVCAAMLVPAYLLVVNAFKPQAAILGSPFSLDAGQLSFRYLHAALTNPNFSLARAYVVSAVVALVSVALVIACGGPLAYLIARRETLPYRILFFSFVAGTFIPSQAILIPVVYILRILHLMNSVPGLLLYEAALFSPMTVFLYVGYIRSVPRELDEAASVDGASLIRTYWQVLFPLLKPATVTVVILNAVFSWNDFVDPLTILGPTSGNHTVTSAIYESIGQYNTNYTAVFPDVLLAVAPAVIFFLFMQRRFISGLLTGATKG